jgi:GntR family transcriptional regulator/MocR family aminotransferase
MRTLYTRRRSALLEGLDKFCGDALTTHCADAGLYVATLLEKGFRDVDVVERMKHVSLSAVSLSSCYITRPLRQGLLLGFGGWDERRLLAATRTLGELLERLQ